MKILILLIIILASGLGYASNTPPTRNESLDGLKQNLKQLQEHYIFQKNKPAPDKHKEELVGQLDSFYRAGFISLTQYNNFISGYMQIRPDSNSEYPLNMRWKAAYDTYTVSKINNLKNNRPANLNKGEVSTAGAQCASDLINAPNPFYEMQNPSCGIKTGEECTSHDQCCSKFCEGTADDGKGSCIPPQSCYKEVAYGDECGPEDPYCDQSEAIPDQEIVECQSVNYNSTNANTCITNTSTQACSSNTDCCSDKCESGKCVPKLICTICKQRGETPTNNRKCCSGLFEALDGTCQPDWPTFILPQASTSSDSIKLIKKIVNTTLNLALDLLVPSAVAQSAQCSGSGCTTQTGYSNLTGDQERKIDELIKGCMGSGDQADIDACMEGVNQQRAALEEENKANGIGPQSMTQEEYVGIYNIPAFTAPEASDVKKCEFNSWKDNWIDASRTEKNAEIVLRAFETILAGNGTSDRIFFDGTNDNIYSRLKEIMKQLRNNRIAMAKALADVDKELSCECMNVFGISSFSSEKQAAYVDNCKGVGEKIVDDDGKNKAEKEVSETDQGASGISHEEFLARWLQKRSQAQLERFENNAAVEEEFQKLIDDINAIDWDKHSRTEEKLYSFTEYWTSGWFIIAVIAVVVVVVVLVVILTGGAAAIGLGAGIGGTTAAITGMGVGVTIGAGALGGGITAALINNEPGEHLERDEVERDTWSDGIFEKRRYGRYLGWDWYEDKSYNSQKCRVRGRKKVCLKNIYVHEPDATLVNDPAYMEIYSAQANSPLIDVWLPLFYPHSDQSKYIADMEYVKLINEGYDRGKQAAINTKPNGEVDRDWKKVGRIRPIIDQGKFNPDISHMTNADGEFKPKYVWNQDKINEIKKAVIKYATCEKLKECGANLTDENADELIGLKYFFQTEDDAKLFADYVYQMHFFWPRLSSDQIYSYPLLGLSAYLDLVNYNVKLLGSLNTMRSSGYADAYEAYNDDLAKRKGDYEQASGDTKMGAISRNAKYSRSLFSAMKLVNFSTGQGVEDFNKAISAGKESGSLTAADSIKNHAMRLKEDQKKSAHYLEHANKTERGKKTLEKARAFSERFNDPLSMIKTMNPGTGVNPLTGKSEAKATDKPAPKAPVISSYKVPEFKMPKSNYNQPSYGSNANSTQAMPAHGLGPEEVTSMLERARKDRSLRNITSDDSIFSIVSKCYKRNLDRVLVSSQDIEKKNKSKTATPVIERKIKPEISDEKKNELKNLLGK